jgi:hypothetical protein
MGQQTLWTLRESKALSADLFRRFRDKAAANGYGATGAILRLIHRYLERGFDDGQPEKAPPVAGSSE